MWPNKNEAFCHVDGDEDATHYGGYINNALVCVASIYINKNSARLRKFATYKTHQGKGIGSTLLQHIINDLKINNMAYFWCDARETAIGFYQRFGLEVEGDLFYKSGVPYYKMSIALK